MKEPVFHITIGVRHACKSQPIPVCQPLHHRTMADCSALTGNQPCRAVWTKLVPKAAEEVQELECTQPGGTGSEGGERHRTDEEQHKHHDEANALHAAAAIPAGHTYQTDRRKQLNAVRMPDGRYMAQAIIV